MLHFGSQLSTVYLLSLESDNTYIVGSKRSTFFCLTPLFVLTLNSEIRGCAQLLGEPLGFGVKKWYF